MHLISLNELWVTAVHCDAWTSIRANCTVDRKTHVPSRGKNCSSPPAFLGTPQLHICPGFRTAAKVHLYSMQYREYLSSLRGCSYISTSNSPSGWKSVCTQCTQFDDFENATLEICASNKPGVIEKNSSHKMVRATLTIERLLSRKWFYTFIVWPPDLNNNYCSAIQSLYYLILIIIQASCSNKIFFCLARALSLDLLHLTTHTSASYPLSQYFLLNI